MIYSIPVEELQHMLIAANELGAKAVIDALGLEKKQITQNEAYTKYGRKRIDQWRKNYDLKPIKQGDRIYYDREKLEQLSTVNKLMYGDERKRQKTNK